MVYKTTADLESANLNEVFRQPNANAVSLMIYPSDLPRLQAVGPEAGTGLEPVPFRCLTA